MTYTLPALPYKFDALEPYFDALTMEIHHDRHHAAYVNNLNAALASQNLDINLPIQELVANLDAVPESIRMAVRNNGGGHANHSFFWEILTGHGTGVPKGEIAQAINRSFGDFETFKSKFSDAAVKRFGSGWAWLVVDKDKSLNIMSTPNQDNPWMEGLEPVLGLDVWEHAYYLKYQNKRPAFIEAFWNVVNWEKVNQLYLNALNKV